MSLTDDERRKRLLFRSWHRGTKEADLLLGSFAEANLPGFSAADIACYEELLDQEDADLWDWMTGHTEPPAELDTEVMRRLRGFRYTARSA
ncbi:MAG TPA: succinate dehydrogenase assembly factor 2 [Aliidongia sp.]|uniref:FAD assembly factor SdhE n=1 Tax=Aliidongia sp. TaxID=1914230 RepID=UPI002DDD7478|nr:succinate dehydrogenase assembly factor 2 [Aliidongia sp.]HEV2676926.1 succinate dehydrogenase assembly factor 2 [Aliidongia sp.]